MLKDEQDCSHNAGLDARPLKIWSESLSLQYARYVCSLSLWFAEFLCEWVSWKNLKNLDIYCWPKVVCMNIFLGIKFPCLGSHDPKNIFKLCYGLSNVVYFKHLLICGCFIKHHQICKRLPIGILHHFVRVVIKLWVP